MNTKIVTVLLFTVGTIFGLSALYLWGRYVQQRSEEALMDAYVRCARLGRVTAPSNVLGENTSQTVQIKNEQWFTECLETQLKQKTQ